MRTYIRMELFVNLTFVNFRVNLVQHVLRNENILIFLLIITFIFYIIPKYKHAEACRRLISIKFAEPDLVNLNELSVSINTHINI